MRLETESGPQDLRVFALDPADPIGSDRAMSASKHAALPDAARLRITLMDLDPAPRRTVEVPLSMSFKGLHDAIRAARGRG